MAENAYLDDGGLQQVVAWLRWKDVGEHQDQEGYYTSEIFNDYENNIALGPYNHIEGGNNIIADTTDKYYAYAGNPFLDIPSDIKLINLVENSSNYHINSEQGIFSLENIELPEIFTVNNYAEDININEYDYIQKDNKWYPIKQNEIDLVNYQNIENMLSDIFGKANSISSVKIFSSAEEPTVPTENLILYNSLAYYGEKTYNLSAEEVTLLTSINTLEIQDNNYITTIYLNESNNFGFVYIMDTNEDEDIIEDEEVETTTDILAEDTNTEDTDNEEQEPTSGDYFSSHSLLINQYDKDNILSIENLTNQIGNFQLINQVYLPHPSAATKENAVYGTNITGIAEYGNQTNLNWEYLNNYDIQLELQPVTRELDEEGNEINPLKVEVNSTTLVNATIDYAQDSLIFTYQEEIDDTGIITSQKWYLYDGEVDLSKYGITVANAENGDSFTIYLNKEYISDNGVLTQSEFYERNHAAGIETYIFQGDNQKWIKKKPDEKIGNEGYCYNHIEGYNNQVKGAYNHAEGKDTIAIGDSSHAEGIHTQATGNSCHSEGYNTTAIGNRCHAEGNATNAAGSDSHVEGTDTRVISGTSNHVEGMSGEVTAGTANHVEGMSSTISDGTANHVEGMSNKVKSGICNHVGGMSNTVSGDHHAVNGHANTIEGGNNTHVSGTGNTLKGCYSSIVGGQSNTVTNDYRSLVCGIENTLTQTDSNLVGGWLIKITNGSNNTVNGQQVTVNGHGNLVCSNGKTINGNYNLVSGLHGKGITGDYNIMGGSSHYDCTGSENLIFGNCNSISGNQNIVGGASNKIVGTETYSQPCANAIFGSNNSIYSGNDNIIGGDSNKSYNSHQFIFGTNLQSGSIDTLKIARSALLIGEHNETDTKYILTNDTIYYDIYGKIYYYIKDNNYYKIDVLTYTTPNSNWYELVNDEYIQTQDKEMIENKEYYYRYSDTDYRLIKIENTEITQPIYEIKQYIMIAGNGTYEKRSNALELDYQGNLNTSGDIVNGDGVIVGASISNDVLDNIWNEVFA